MLLSSLLSNSEKKITIQVNGNPIICFQNISLAGLLNYLNFDLRQIIVEHNSEIVQKEQLHNQKLSDQDIIEIITIVGGG